MTEGKILIEVQHVINQQRIETIAEVKEMLKTQEGKIKMLLKEQLDNVKEALAIAAELNMSCRDQFAMAALTGITANSKFKVEEVESLGKACYTLADLLLKEREGKHHD